MQGLRKRSVIVQNGRNLKMSGWCYPIAHLMDKTPQFVHFECNRVEMVIYLSF